MKEKMVNLKNKIIPFIKTHKISLIIIFIVILILVLGAIIIFNKTKIGNLAGNLNNLGFSLKSGKYVYYLGFNDNQTDGIYRIKSNGDEKEKISDSYGFYLNQCGNYLYFLEADAENYNIYNIVKMKTNGKDKEIVVQDVDTLKITVIDNWIYYFKNYQLYRVKTNGKNKEQISNKLILNYEVEKNWIYYSYINDEKYVIARMNTNGDDITILDSDADKNFFINKNYIYYIHENNESNTVVYELYKVKTNGKNKEKIIEIDGDIDLNSLNFDGKRLYYLKATSDGALSIYSIRTNGKNETKIVDIEGYSTKININDGKVYYTDIKDDGESEIFVVDINGENKKII